MQGGQIRFEECRDGEEQSIITRITVGGISEAEAKKTAEDQDKFTIKKSDKGVIVEDDLEGGFGGGGIIIGDGNVVINGRGASTRGVSFVGGNVVIGSGNFSGGDVIINRLLS